MSTALLFLKGSFARTLETFVMIATGFFLLPFLVRHLGEDLYGLWVLVSSITAAFYLFDLGFASAVTRFVARNLSQKNYQYVNEIISSSLLIYSILALIIIAASLSVAAVASYWISSENTGLVQLLIVITGTSLALEFPFKSFAGVVSSYMRYDLLSYSRVIFKLISTALTVYFVLQGYQLLAIALIGLVTQFLSNLSFYYISKSVYQKMEVRSKLIRKSTIKELFSYSSWAFLVDITQLAKNKADIFIIGGLLSTSILTIYYVGARLADYALEFLRKAMNMTTPIFARAHALNDLPGLGEKVLLFCRLNTFMAGLCAMVLIGFGESIIQVWMGSEFDAGLAYTSLVFLTIGRMLLFSFSPLSSCLYAISKHQFQAWIEIAEAIVSIPLSIYLIKFLDLGLLGAAAGITAPYYISRVFILPMITLKQLNYSRRKFYIRLSPAIVFAISACIVTKFVYSSFVVSTTLTMLLIAIAAFSGIYLMLSFLLLESIEREHAMSLARKITSKLTRFTSRKSSRQAL